MKKKNTEKVYIHRYIHIWQQHNTKNPVSSYQPLEREKERKGEHYDETFQLVRKSPKRSVEQN